MHSRMAGCMCMCVQVWLNFVGCRYAYAWMGIRSAQGRQSAGTHVHNIDGMVATCTRRGWAGTPSSISRTSMGTWRTSSSLRIQAGGRTRLWCPKRCVKKVTYSSFMTRLDAAYHAYHASAELCGSLAECRRWNVGCFTGSNMTRLHRAAISSCCIDS